MPANKTALLTVGSTEFTPLVQAALGDDVQAALTGSGFTQFTVQYGKSRLGKGYDIGYSSAGVVRTVQRAGISIHLLPFVADIEQRMASSDLVISHAGAGSVLASLRGPALSPLSASSKPVPQLIVVPNDSLMDSHQSDLAEQLDSRGWATVSSPGALAHTIRNLPADSLTTATTFPAFDASRISSLIDSHMGFA